MKAAFFKPSELRLRATREQVNARSANLALANAINERVTRTTAEFDAYLAYSSPDWQVVYGLYRELISRGISVYLDRIEDAHLHPGNVSAETAAALRNRMKTCRSLLFATTENYSASKWMPWEIGFFDGFRGKVAIVPVREDGDFTGQEYLGLYPVMEADTWLHRPNGELLTRFPQWLAT